MPDFFFTLFLWVCGMNAHDRVSYTGMKIHLLRGSITSCLRQNNSFPKNKKISNECVIFCLQVKLEHVLGLTVTSNSALDCDTKTGIIAYPAG